MRDLLASVRTRILVAYVALLAITVVVSFLIARQILIVRIDERIDQELLQESRELRSLANGDDPETGAAFGTDAKRIFRVFLERNIPSRNEALLTFVDGAPFLRSRQVVPYRLDTDPELVARWGDTSVPDRGRAPTPVGPIEYLAVPLEGGGVVRGVFVVAIFRDREVAEVDSAVATVGGVGLALLIVGSLLAWRLAEGVLRPVRNVANAARSISESDLSRRIPTQGRDEVAQLGETFNEMLDRLEDAFETQRRFLDDAAHELRTPITIVRGHLELLGDDPQERRETVDLVTDELDRMSRMVNDLLLLAKAERPDFLDLETVDVGALTTELHAKTAALAPRDWRLERRGSGVIVADRQRLTQALVQLADNAASHTRVGAAIWLGSVVEHGEARFWIRDTGHGLPPEAGDDIFARFQRGPDSVGGDGAGIGLAIVRAIAEAHHGRVTVSSAPGEGATFSLTIPVDQPHDAESTEL